MKYLFVQFVKLTQTIFLISFFSGRNRIIKYSILNQLNWIPVTNSFWVYKITIKLIIFEIIIML
jgi:hypothetical protein